MFNLAVFKRKGKMSLHTKKRSIKSVSFLTKFIVFLNQQEINSIGNLGDQNIFQRRFWISLINNLIFTHIVIKKNIQGDSKTFAKCERTRCAKTNENYIAT